MKKTVVFMMSIVLIMTGAVNAALPVTSGLVTHLDADSLGLSNGASVATWTDLSGLGNHATQVTAGNQPTYVAHSAAFGNHASVRFDGTDDWMDMVDAITVNSFTVFITGKLNDAGATTQQYFISGQSGNPTALDNRFRIAKYNWSTAWRFRAGNSADYGSGTVDTLGHVLAMNSVSNAWVDGSAVTGATNSASSTPALSLGGYMRTGGADFLNGEIAEVILYNRVLNSTEMEQVFFYLSTKVPYDPVVDEVTPTTVVLNWKAAADPTGANAVNPDIVDQYVFMSDGSGTDPNLYYLGATGVDPGTDDPTSQYPGTGTVTVATDSTYEWAVVEAMDGNTQSLTPGVSKITQVDPNNIIGPVWTYVSQTSVPTISQQPEDARAFSTDPNAVFICEFSSVESATVLWYKSGNATPLSTGGDIVITLTDDGNDNYISTLEIFTPVLADEGEYYCEIDNGTPLVTSDTAALIIKRLMAQYDFDGDLAPATGSAADAPTGTALDTQGDPNSLLAVPAMINYVNGADYAITGGQSLYLDPNEYVDFGVEGYPKAYPVTSNGYGGGLDEGTIVFWVKPDVDKYQIVLGNFNDTTTGTGFLSALQADGDNDLLVRNAAVYLANHVAGRPDRPEYDLTDTAWHMIAACWSGNNSRLFVDGQSVGSFTGTTPASYDAWQRGVLLGSSRQGARHLLSDMFGGGAIDNLRIYNYRIDNGDAVLDIDAFAQEYYDNTGILPCTDTLFWGGAANLDNTGSSYCKIDLADFAEFALRWLTNGLYPQD